MTAITGNTYPVKDQLKVIGARWNPGAKVWMVPDDKAAQARALVLSSTKDVPSRPAKCRVCGFVPTRNSRGFLDQAILRSGECQSCYEERKMGY